MPNYTTNHAFQLFADDETPWEHRSDFQKLDDRTPIVDTDANKSNYTPKSDSLFFASDTEALYRGNGTSWVEIRAIGSGGGGGDHIGSDTDPVLSITNTHYREVTNTASVSGSYTVDLTAANVHKLTLTGDTTISFTGDHQDLTTGCTVIIQQDATGGHSLDWGSDIYWPSGTVPSLSTDPNKRHKLVFESVAGEWEGAVVAENLTFVASNTIDDFEWGGPIGDRYEGATTQYTIATTHPTVSGQYALEGVPSAAGQRAELFSQDGAGLANNPSRGDSFGGWIRSSTLNDVRSGLIFGVQDSNNYYVARVTFDSTNGSELQLATRVGGTYSAAATDPMSLSVDTYYDIQVNWGTDDTITVTVVDQSGTTVGSVTWTDTSSTFATESGFGFYIYQGGTVDGATYFDDARML